jgi:uncharacterized phiE125 gp8 family phage protein
MARLTSVDDLKTYLRIPATETSRDDLLATIVEEATSDFEGETDRTVAKQAYSNEAHEGGGSKIVLKNYPVDTAETFQLKDFNADTQTTTIYDSSDYVVDADTGIVTLLGGLTFSPGPNGAQASYNAGYAQTGTAGATDEATDVPATLSRSVKVLCAARFKFQQGAITRDELDKEEAAASKIWAGFRAH